MICYSLISKSLLNKINISLNNSTVTQGMKSIKVFDVIGICENQNNLGLDEFFINYSNEKLRQVFYEHLLENSPVEFQDNTGCVLLSEKLCKLLQNENSNPSLDLSSFITQIEEISQQNNYGEVVDNKKLKVEHYIGPVFYSLSEWFPVLHHSSPMIIEKLGIIILSSALFKKEIRTSDIERLQNHLSKRYFLTSLLNLAQSFQGTSNHFIYCLRTNVTTNINKEDNNNNNSSSNGEKNQINNNNSTSTSTNNENNNINNDLDPDNILPQLKSHGIIELAEISKFTEQNEYSTVEYCNTYPGSSSKQKKKKKKKRTSGNPRKIFSTPFHHSSKSSAGKSDTNDLQVDLPKRSNNNSSTNLSSISPTTHSSLTGGESPRRRSRSFKNRIRPKSRIFKADEIQQNSSATNTQPATFLPKKKDHAFMKNSSSLSTRSLQLEYQSGLSPLRTARGFDEAELLDFVSSSESSDSLAVSSDELSLISSDEIECITEDENTTSDNENSTCSISKSDDSSSTTSLTTPKSSNSNSQLRNYLYLSPSVKTLKNRILFPQRYKKLSESQDEQYFLALIEKFCWREHSDVHIIDNIDILQELTRLKLQNEYSTNTLSAKEILSRKQKFLDVYKCGSLLRTLYQSEELSSTSGPTFTSTGMVPNHNDENSLTARKKKQIFEGSLQRSSSEGNIGRIRPSSSTSSGNGNVGESLSSSTGGRRVTQLKQQQQSTTTSPRFSDDDSDEEDVGISETDECSTDKVNWKSDVWQNSNSRKNSTIHLTMDTVDDTLNQINYSNTVKPSPRKRKTIM